jgi:hypothetical protein
MARYDDDRVLAQKIVNRMEEVERIAVKLGFLVLRDRKGKRSGIVQAKPSLTVLAERQFKAENLYRTLSGMAHADYTSLTAFSFLKTAAKRRQGALLVRAVPKEVQSALVSTAATIYTKCAWLRILQFKLDAATVAVLLEEYYDDLQLPDTNSDRFWRTVIYRSR